MADLERWGPDYAGLSFPDDQSPRGLSRRRFLQLSALGAGTAIVAPSWLGDVAGAAAPLGPTDGILVLVMMGGGNDGLDTLIPHGDGRYYDLRRRTAWSADQTLPVAPGFGLHPSLTGIKSRYDVGDVALIRGVGYNNPTPNLSHFDSMAIWMRGHRTSSASTGWIGRYLDGLGPDALNAVTIGSSIPLHLVGATTRATGLPESINGAFGVDRTRTWQTKQYDAVTAYAAQSSGLGTLADTLARSGRDTVDLGTRLNSAYVGDLPDGDLPRQLTLAARLINANLGIRVINTAFGDFDDHDDLRNRHSANMSEFDTAVAEFYRTLSPAWADRVTILTFSEFGRRAFDNESYGTDHGTASTLLAIGSRVRGGLYGAQPGLADAQLDNHDNLVANVDFRSVYATVLDGWLGGDSTQILGGTYENLGFLESPGGTGGGVPPIVTTAGYWMLDRSGTVHAFGTAPNLGSPMGIGNAMALAPTPDRGGYWVAGADGAVYSYGNAIYAGGMNGRGLNSPIVSMAPTPTGQGYWLLGADGGVFSFGDAAFYGSTGGLPLNAPVVAMASTPTGGGYWFVASDGGIFAFGDAAFYGSMGGTPLNAPIVGMAPSASGRGYWLVAADGGIFAFGDAAFHGSTGNIRLNRPVVSMSRTPSGAGYWFVADDGGVFAFGDAGFAGSMGATPPSGGVVGLA